MAKIQAQKTNGTLDAKLQSGPTSHLSNNHSFTRENDIHNLHSRNPSSPCQPQESYEQRAQEEEDKEAKEDNVSQVVEIRNDVVGTRDVEQGHLSVEKSTSSISREDKDPNIVTWDGPDDSANPKNWSTKRKWAATVIVSLFAFISPVSSTMVAPSLKAMSAEFHVTNDAVSALMLSIFLLAFIVGPLLLGPLSEVYGRVHVLQLANLFYIVFNLACGFAQTSGQMLAFRFLSGFGGSASMVIGGGVLADCWRPEQRGKAVGVYSLAPLLGPAIGPIAGGFVTEKTTWRWIFYATCIVAILVQILGYFFLQETFAPKLLQEKTLRLRKETGNDSLQSTFYEDITIWKRISLAIRRPFILISTQPIVQVLAIYMAYTNGLAYLVLSTFPRLWENVYGESVGIGGLNYISLAVGLTFGAQVSARLNDRIYRKLKKQNNNVAKPEFRAVMMIPASLFVPIGLFWYGWSAEARLHWIMPNIGVAIMSAGNITASLCIQTYIIDAYTKNAASALAAAALLRSVAASSFPLFAPSMYRALGYGWGNSLLAFVAIGLGIPAPLLLWKYGERLRARSTFAAGG